MARLLTPFVFLAFKWDHHRASWPLVGKSWIYTEDRGEIKDRLDAKLSRNLTQIYNTNEWLQYYPEYSIIRNNVNPYQSNNGNEIWSDNKSTMDPYNAWIEIRAATKLAKVSTKKAKKKKDEKLFNKNYFFKKFACTPKKIFYKSYKIGCSSSFSLDWKRISRRGILLLFLRATKLEWRLRVRENNGYN